MKKFNNFTDKNSLEMLFEEIDKNLKNKNHLSALMLSLTIPDALGKVAYPKIGKSKPRYIKWFDENVKNIFGLLYSDGFYEPWGFPRMNGTICYKLRCALFHDGGNDLKKDTGIDEFVLSLSDEEFVRGNYAGNEYLFDEWNPKTGEVPQNAYLYVSCKELSLNIVNSAKEFIKNNPDLDYPTLRVNYGGGKISDVWFVK